MSLIEFLSDWWQFLAFVAGGFVAFLLGRERQGFKVDEIGREQEKQGKRIENLEKQGNVEAVQVAEVITTQGHILRELREIKGLISTKADK